MTTFTYRYAPWPVKLLQKHPQVGVTVADCAIIIATKDGAVRQRIPVTGLQAINHRPSALGGELVIHDQSGQTLAIKGVNGDQYRNIEAAIAHCAQQQADRLTQDIRQTKAKLNRLLDGSRWIQANELDAITGAASLSPDIPEQLVADALTKDAATALTQIHAMRDPDHAEQARRRNNDQYRRQAAKQAHASARRHLDINLTQEQAEAVATDEDVTRVLAGAGSGKTAVIAAKIVHLVHDRHVPPEQVLALAYNRDAAQEIRHRLHQAVRPLPRVRTFHTCALAICGEAEGVKPTVSPLATDERKLVQFITARLEALTADPEAGPAVNRLLTSHQREYRSMWDFATPAEYHEYIRAAELRTLQGELVKSFEELSIANWLAMNGVPYRYEMPYPVETASPSHRQYHPDFYLPEHDIYIEHFALDENDNAPPGWSQYAQSVAWKRQIHRDNGTALSETYSRERQQGVLERNLARKLAGTGVSVKPISHRELLAQLREQGVISQTARLVMQLLNLAHANGMAPDDLEREAAAKSRETRRARDILLAYRRILADYRRQLAKENATDFHDMISSAAGHINAGRWRNRYRYVLVDEFQDISASRMALLQALRGAGSAVFAVGDDWQSIYRFTGSRMDIFNRCEEYLGPTETVTLPHTFRSNAGIASAARKFITRNPAQSQRATLPNLNAPDGGIAIVYAPNNQAGIQTALADMAKGNAAPDRAIILGRYNRTGQDAGDAKAAFSTVHAAKGLEADFAIVADLNNRRHGFPSQVTDDPIMDIARPDASDDPVEFAEERRLLYVAITRARQAAYLVAEATEPSAFVKELRKDFPQIRVIGDPAPECPACSYGTMRLSQSGANLACTRYPECSYLEPLCYGCREDYIRIDFQTLTTRCANPDCKEAPPVCPACRQGIMTPRNGHKFWGCSQWQRRDLPCLFTTPVCAKCHTGYVAVDAESKTARCVNEQCGHRHEVCGKCRAGVMTRKHGRNGAFVSCSRYHDTGCRNTRNLPQKRSRHKDNLKPHQQASSGRHR